MKKGLSVLLVAAALFGFYGGAVNMNDVLACKDYWEKEGEKTTADLNKLEDGLNQLKDNEKAYLDGCDQVAEGEKTLADGEAQYAEGLADYAAAPGKLAAARKQIAQGESDLADGKESLDGLTKLISGIKMVRNGYNSEWRPGYEKLKSGRNQLFDGTKALKDQMVQLAAFLDEEALRPDFVAAVNDVAGDDEKQTADDYKKFIESTNTLATDLPLIQNSVATKLAGANQIKAVLGSAGSNLEFAGTVANEAVYPNLKAFAALITDENSRTAYLQAVEGANKAFSTYSDLTTQEVTDEVTAYMAPLLQGDTSSQAYQDMVAKMQTGMDKDAAVEAIKKEKTASATASAKQKYGAAAEQNDQLTAAKAGINNAMTQIAGTLAGVNAIVNGDKVNKELLPGLKMFNKEATPDKVDKLSEGQNTMAGGVATIASAVLGNPTLKEGVKSSFGSDALKLLGVYKSVGVLGTELSDFARFEAQMDTNPGINNFLMKAQNLLAATKAAGQKTYNAGVKKLAAGKNQYAQGLADYAAAPAKLADAEQQLADGRAQLADGKSQLAEYEDGEQQVRDGLATLVGTESDLDLESILDRLDGDGDFDNGDKHLEIDEGLAAVEAGRGYQADDSELITAEIMTRAVGTGALLAAGVLAVLAAILSFVKKNKGAGVLAVLSAAAGAFGAVEASQAGSYFSNIAGSTAGQSGMIAAGILGCVALVHAIVHFTAKKEA